MRIRTFQRPARLVLWLLVAVLSTGFAGGAAGLAVGDPAPPWSFDAIYDGKTLAALTGVELDGEAVVLEFWATWCGPCIGAIRHWNELVEELAGERIRFVSVTDEDMAVVGPFVGRRPIRGWLAVDTDRSLFDDYGVDGIPYTVLVDAKGVVRGITDPHQVTSAMLRRLAAGEDVKAPPRLTASEAFAALEESFDDPAGSPRPIVRVVVRPSRFSMKAVQAGESFFRSAGCGLEMAVQNAFQVPWTRILFERDIPPDVFDILVEAPSADERDQLLRSAVQAAFGVVATWEERDVRVFRLARAPGATPPVLPSTAEEPSSRSRAARLEGVGLTGDDLARRLERHLGRPVLAAADLDGRFDVSLTWDPEVPGDLARVLEQRLELQLHDGTASLPVLVVR